jgi:hypothetical protein
MNPEDFIRWALDDARTLEERYATELLIEDAESRWNSVHQTGVWTRWEETAALQRERFLNPAYQPAYSEQSVRRAAEILPTMTTWRLTSSSHNERPVRDMAVLRFLPALEDLTIGCEIADLSLLTELPALRALSFSSPVCEDYRPLARCTQLRRLTLSLGVHWPEVAGLENLQLLESLELSGNLLVFPKGITFPRVHTGKLNCAPLHARCVRDLPQLPACEFLTLAGVERLDGIDAFPRLRNLNLTGPVRDFSPLTVLGDLTWLAYDGGLPLDVSPVARLPRLLCATFKTAHVWGSERAPLRDYSPLAAAPMLRELHVDGCPPLEMEVAALNAGLPPWDDLLLAPEPRPIPPLRVVIAPHSRFPKRDSSPRAPGEPEREDPGISVCEGKWVSAYATRIVGERIGHADWGKVNASGGGGGFIVWVECYEVVERLLEIVEAMREVLARLRDEYEGQVFIALKAPPPEPTEAQRELLQRFRDDQEEAEHERRQEEQRERLDRLYLYQLKQQEGEAVAPEEFTAPPPKPLPPAPWEVEDDEEDEDEFGDTAVKQKTEPPPDLWDDEHPLANNYRMYATLTLNGLWVIHRDADICQHLLGREADEELPDDKQP